MRHDARGGPMARLTGICRQPHRKSFSRPMGGASYSRAGSVAGDPDSLGAGTLSGTGGPPHVIGRCWAWGGSLCGLGSGSGRGDTSPRSGKQTCKHGASWRRALVARGLERGLARSSRSWPFDRIGLGRGVSVGRDRRVQAVSRCSPGPTPAACEALGTSSPQHIQPPFPRSPHGTRSLDGDPHTGEHMGVIARAREEASPRRREIPSGAKQRPRGSRPPQRSWRTDTPQLTPPPPSPPSLPAAPHPPQTRICKKRTFCTCRIVAPRPRRICLSLPVKNRALGRARGTEAI